MCDFYQKAPSEQAAAYAILAQKALSSWGIENAELALLKMRENAVFAVTTTTGTRYALRLHRAGYHSDDELRSELQWMKALDDAGIFTPEVLVTESGKLFDCVTVPEVPEPRQVDLLGWVEGEALGTLEEGVDADVDELLKNYQTIGELAARLHNQANAWTLPEGFARHAWDVDGLVGEQPVWGRFWEYDGLSEEQKALMLQAREVVRGALEELGTGPECYGLIHADFLPENLILDGQKIQLIDFDDAGFGWYLFELATSLFVHLGEDYFDELCAALLTGYRKQRALPDEQLAYLPVFFMARLFTYLGWLHTREKTETTEEMAPVIVAAATELAQQLLSDSVG